MYRGNLSELKPGDTFKLHLFGSVFILEDITFIPTHNLEIDRQYRIKAFVKDESGRTLKRFEGVFEDERLRSSIQKWVLYRKCWRFGKKPENRRHNRLYEVD